MWKAASALAIHLGEDWGVRCNGCECYGGERPISSKKRQARLTFAGVVATEFGSFDGLAYASSGTYSISLVLQVPSSLSPIGEAYLWHMLSGVNFVLKEQRLCFKDATLCVEEEQNRLEATYTIPSEVADGID